MLSPPGGDLSAHGDDDLADVSVSNHEGAHNIARVSSHGARVGTDGRSDLDGVFVPRCLDGGGDFCNSGSVTFCHRILLALNDLVGVPSGGSVCFLCDTFGDFCFLSVATALASHMPPRVYFVPQLCFPHVICTIAMGAPVIMGFSLIVCAPVAEACPGGFSPMQMCLFYGLIIAKTTHMCFKLEIEMFTNKLVMSFIRCSSLTHSLPWRATDKQS